MKLQQERVREADPQKAEQMERLGFASNPVTNRSAVKSHSALTDMVVIDQVGSSSNNRSNNFYSSRESNARFGGSSGLYNDDELGKRSKSNRNHDDNNDMFFDAISDEPSFKSVFNLNFDFISRSCIIAKEFFYR